MQENTGLRTLWRMAEGNVLAGPGRKLYLTEECCCTGCWIKYESTCDPSAGGWTKPVVVLAGCMPKPADAVPGKWLLDEGNKARAYMWMQPEDMGPGHCEDASCQESPPEVDPPDLPCGCVPFTLTYRGSLPHIVYRTNLFKVSTWSIGGTPELPTSTLQGTSRLSVADLGELPPETAGIKYTVSRDGYAVMPLYFDNFNDLPELNAPESCCFPTPEENAAWSAVRDSAMHGSHAVWTATVDGNSFDLYETPGGILPQDIRPFSYVDPGDCMIRDGAVVSVCLDGESDTWRLETLAEAPVASRSERHPRFHSMGTMGSFAYDQWGYMDYGTACAVTDAPELPPLELVGVLEARGGFTEKQNVYHSSFDLSGYHLEGSPMWVYRAHLVTRYDIDGLNREIYGSRLKADSGHEVSRPMGINAGIMGDFCPTYWHMYITEAWGMCPDDPALLLPHGQGTLKGEHCMPVAANATTDNNIARDPKPYWAEGNFNDRYDSGVTYWLHEADEEVIPPAPPDPQAPQPQAAAADTADSSGGPALPGPDGPGGQDPGNPGPVRPGPAEPPPGSPDPALQGYRPLNVMTDGHAYKVSKLCIDNFPSWFYSSLCSAPVDGSLPEVPMLDFNLAAWYCASCHAESAETPVPELDNCGWKPDTAAADRMNLHMDALTRECSYRSTYGPVRRIEHIGGRIGPDDDAAVSFVKRLDDVYVDQAGTSRCRLDRLYEGAGCPDYTARVCSYTLTEYDEYKKIFTDKDHPDVPSWHLLGHRSSLKIDPKMLPSLPDVVQTWTGQYPDPVSCGSHRPEDPAVAAGAIDEDFGSGRRQGSRTAGLLHLDYTNSLCEQHRCEDDATLPVSMFIKLDQDYQAYVEPEQFRRAAASGLQLDLDQLPDLSKPEDFCPEVYIPKGAKMVFTASYEQLDDLDLFFFTDAYFVNNLAGTSMHMAGEGVKTVGTFHKSMVGTVSHVFQSDVAVGPQGIKVDFSDKLEMNWNEHWVDDDLVDINRRLRARATTVQGHDSGVVPFPLSVDISRTRNGYGKWTTTVKVPWMGEHGVSGMQIQQTSWASVSRFMGGEVQYETVSDWELLNLLKPHTEIDPAKMSYDPDPRLDGYYMNLPKMWEKFRRTEGWAPRQMTSANNTLTYTYRATSSGTDMSSYTTGFDPTEDYYTYIVYEENNTDSRSIDGKFELQLPEFKIGKPPTEGV